MRISFEDFEKQSYKEKEARLNLILEHWQTEEDKNDPIYKFWKAYADQQLQQDKEAEDNLNDRQEETGKSDLETYLELKEELKEMLDNGKDKNDPEVQKKFSQLDELYNRIIENGTQEEIDKVTEEHESTDEMTEEEKIYYRPTSSQADTAITLDDMFGDAEKLASGSTPELKTDKLVEFSGSIYNIFLAMATVVAVIVGAVLGVKFMLGSAEEKADINKMIIAYVVGCIVIFGGFAIWKIVVTILQQI